jgi:streptogramin lyase
MTLDELIVRELETEQAAVPAHGGSIELVIARGKRRKAIANALVAMTAAVIIVAVVGVTAWIAGFRGTTTDVVNEPTVPETWTTYTQADGLAGNCTSGFAVGADGTLWTVAPDGAFWFDGSVWVAEALPPGFHGGCSTTVAAAPDGTMWFSGESGAAHYDKGTWTVIEPFNVEEWGGFYGIAVTGDGVVWAIEGDFLTRLVDDSFELVDEGFQPMPGHDWPEESSPMSVSITVAPDGSLWASGGPEAVFSRLYHLTETGVTVVDIGGEGPGELIGIAPDGELWFSVEFWGPSNNVADDVGLLLRFDGQSWTEYDLGGVVGATFEVDGTAWFIVDEIVGEDTWWRNQYAEPGVYHFDGETWRHLTVEDGLAGLDLTSVISTADGSIWFGTSSSGVTRYQPGTNPMSGTPVEISGTPFPEGEWPNDATTTTPPPVP